VLEKKNNTKICVGARHYFIDPEKATAAGKLVDAE
jgi:hypothetical protein